MKTKRKTSKVLARTLYTYVKPVNDKWVRTNFKKNGFTSYSQFVDALLTVARHGGVRLRMVPNPKHTSKAA